jgi:hypothetical protein
MNEDENISLSDSALSRLGIGDDVNFEEEILNETSDDDLFTISDYISSNINVGPLTIDEDGNNVIETLRGTIEALERRMVMLEDQLRNVSNNARQDTETLEMRFGLLDEQLGDIGQYGFINYHPHLRDKIESTEMMSIRNDERISEIESKIDKLETY